jgi:2-keto-4-pentenoate hydratase/2-oxohepta-3-ene-1,7-dioic acid hydratase in catechol pathway
MKLTTYTHNRLQRLGAAVAEDRIIIDLQAADRCLARKEARKPHDWFGDMIQFLEAGTKARTAAKRSLRLIGDAPRIDSKLAHEVRRVKLCAPVPRPRKLLALAGNYMEHIREGGQRMAMQDSQTPRVFMKPPSSTVIGPGDAIRIPPIARAIDWEGELAVVIGRNAKRVKAKDALKYVAGYTIMNDVSERKLKIWKRDEERPQDKWFDWLNGKWLDTFAPQGPWLVTTDEIRDPQKLQISTYVNGERKQHNSTSQMIFSVKRIIEYISAFVLLEPGDIISTGTIAGVGIAAGTFMKPGDKVDIAISKIGVLRNRVASCKR